MCFFLLSADIILVLLAILFPPIPVWIKRGICSADSLINIALCMLGFIPGLLHSWYIIARFPEEPFVDGTDLESQTGRNSQPRFSTFYTRQQFNYSPVPQQDSGVFAPNLSSPSVPDATHSTPVFASVPVQPESNDAGPSSEPTPPPYEEVANDNHKAPEDNKVQSNDS
ncbi:hypothetical protein V1512DRAFT_271458 [Lipomyces arxii]|uniref:uncharacterized protein n=1 Tax=Lipomyces arxii TaxID=56418 RepID=UPI0034D020E3